jgi:hypothetical protein
VEVIDMDTPADTLDQTDEDVLSYTISDEAMEAAVSSIATWVTGCFCTGPVCLTVTPGTGC